ncbi:MAG TPA: ATP-dependent DNA ligase, partial [Acidimicrobiia bacterium]|nr:ATP-dependent DNA ligase [Acidimicrobiia bacterium]
MLATLTDHYFSSRDWIYERKLDGERVLGVRSATSTSLYSRSRQVLDGAYPEIVDALDVQGARDFTVDGEVVAFEGAATSFARLQRRMQT